MDTSACTWEALRLLGCSKVLRRRPASSSTGRNTGSPCVGWGNTGERIYTHGTCGQPVSRFDVNSTYEKPKFVSDSYLGMLLMQMKNDGYSVFVVRGNFPQTSIEKDNRRLEELVQACSDIQVTQELGQL